MIGTTEIIIIGAVVFVLFGATAIPKFAKSLGQAKREFKQGFKDGEEEPEADEATTVKKKTK